LGSSKPIFQAFPHSWEKTFRHSFSQNMLIFKVRQVKKT
jgi:hypothetical protein